MPVALLGIEILSPQPNITELDELTRQLFSALNLELPLATDISIIDEHSEKTRSPRFETLLGIENPRRLLQVIKAKSPIVVSLLELANETVVNARQLENAPVPIVTTEAGIEIEPRYSQCPKAYPLINKIVSGRTALLMDDP